MKKMNGKGAQGKVLQVLTVKGRKVNIRVGSTIFLYKKYVCLCVHMCLYMNTCMRVGVHVPISVLAKD